MQEFLQIALSFPTVVFSGLLIGVMLYWIMVIAGAVDLDLLDVDVDIESDLDFDVDLDVPDADLDVDADADVDVEPPSAGMVRALMGVIGLGTVPVTIIASIMTLVSWFLCFALIYYLGTMVGASVFAGLGIVAACFVLSLPITSVFTHPLKGVFKTHTHSGGETLVGKVCQVTSGSVTEVFGTAEVDDGGAGLVVAIRCETEAKLKRGSTALLIDYDPKDDTYFVEPYDDLLTGAGDQGAHDEMTFGVIESDHEVGQAQEQPTPNNSTADNLE
jgi:hypothetical protein